jgi:hypothetical protein
VDYTYFVSGLLTGKIQQRHKTAIRKTIKGLLLQRGIPLHVTNIWNALYYHWDFEGGCHSRLNPDRIETRALGNTDWAIPVGGFVRIATGSKEIWAEVVYKEGRNPAVSSAEGGVDWSIPPGLVNVPRAAVRQFDGQQVEMLDELLVLDFNAFGMEHLDKKVIKRLQDRGRRLDQWGHISMQAAYLLGDSELDDAAYFATHLLARHRGGLLDEFLTRQLTDDELRELLLPSLRTVSDLAAEIDGVRQWNGYFFLDEDYQRAIADQGRDSDFGADMFRSIFRNVLRLPTQRRFDADQPQVECSAIVPALRYYASRQGIDEDELRALSGPQHSRLVCWLNTYIAEEIRKTKGGVVSFGREQFAVRRADPWLFGGVWRSERIKSQVPIHATIPALVPLPLDRQDLPPIDYVKRELAAGLALTEMPVEFRRKRRRITLFLSQRSIEQERLPLGRAVAALSANCEEIRIQIGIEGEQTIWLNQRVRIDRERAVLTDVPFGTQFYPGLRLTGFAEPSGEVIRLYAKRLLTPKVIEGERLDFELDDGLYLSNRPMNRDRLRRASTFSELIGRVFHSRGRTLEDGALALSLQEAVVALFGPNADLDTARMVAAELTRLDKHPDGRYVWRPIINRRTKVSDAEIIKVFRASDAGKRLHHSINAHPVLMHLRRNPPHDDGKWRLRAEQYKRELLATGAQHRLPPNLPRDCTFVTAHQRGQKIGTTDGGEGRSLTTIQMALFPDFHRD